MQVRLVQTVDGAFREMPRRILIATCLLMVGVIGVLDHLTGYETSFSIFYAATLVESVRSTDVVGRLGGDSACRRA